MSELREPQPAKLIVGLLFSNLELHQSVLESLSSQFGPIDLLTEPLLFTYTTYYEREFGHGLYRRLVSFLELVRQETLPDIKLSSSRLEADCSINGRRRINIDPGLLTEERVVLATGKNYTHRIYLRHGVFADLTLIYQSGAYQALPWTYPDYRELPLFHFFAALRQKLMYQRSGGLPRKY